MKKLFESFQNYLDEETDNQPGVKCNCLCTDCVFNKNKQCIAESINLKWAQTEDQRWICECITYKTGPDEKPGPDEETIEEQ